MKRFLASLLVVMLVAVVTAPALAWEFSMAGEAEYRYRYFARQGSADLFGGQAGFLGGVATGTIGFAGPVANTVLVQGFSAKGADASIEASRVWFYPELRVNAAIRLRGEYRVTGTNFRALYDGTGINTTGGLTADNWVSNLHYNGWYVTGSGMGDSAGGMSVPMWEKFWMTAQLPWGIVAIGRRPFAFGLGWSTLHGQGTDTERYSIAVPYGPLRFIWGQRLSVKGDGFGENSIGIVGVQNSAPLFPQQVNAARAAMGTDKNRVRHFDGHLGVTYRSGAVDMGTLANINVARNTHLLPHVAGPAARDDSVTGVLQAILIGGTNPNTGVPMYGDVGLVLWDTYVKYNNGRFFFNVDYAVQYGDSTRKGGRPVSMLADSREVELGCFFGNTKLTAAYFYHSGHDRRGGNLNPAFAFGTLGAVQLYDKWCSYLVFGDAEESIKPYEFLLGIYGGGNNSYDARGYATFQDFEAFAGRLDYAVAANLNLFGSFIYANRASNTGTSIGFFTGGATPRVALPGVATPQANVPDNYLGWEAGVGADWKLLEGLTFSTRLAYWQPGDWFKWAYQDYGSLAITNVSGQNYSVNPDRGIDPIIGFQTSVLVEF